MLFRSSGCGWIPDAPVKFMYHIINLIKNLTPVILIIMGSIDFAKAVISQKEDEIKKAQTAFIKKLIAGAAVFFVVVFARWIVDIVNNAGGNANNAFRCASLLLKGSYSADDKTYYDGSNILKKTTTTVTTNRPKYDKYSDQQLFNIITSCSSFNISSYEGLDCINAKDNFCKRMFNDSTCQNFCNGINFNTADLESTFRGSHPTGANGCKIDNISSFINSNNANKPQQKDELESCKPPSCECKYQENKNKCDAEVKNNQQTVLTNDNCVMRLDSMISSYCSSSESQATINNFDDFINDYAKNYAEDALYDWLDSGDADQFFIYENRFNCGRAYSTKMKDLTYICDNRIEY